MDEDTAAIPAELAARFAAQGARPRFEGRSSALYDGHEAGAHVVVKVLRAAAIATPDERRRVVRETQRLVTVRHDALPSVLAAGESDGSIWLARTVFEGESAQARLASAGAMPWRDVAGLGAKLASAIAELHKQRVVHRDVCTRHVLLGAGDAVALLDAATGRVMAAGAGRATVGTPGFASPEAVAGRFVSSPSDLYALGATLFELLAGTPPFGHGDDAEVLARQAAAERVAKLPDGTPPSLRELLDALLAAEPSKRPSSAMMVERRLAKIASEPDPAATRLIAVPPDPGPTRVVQAPPPDVEASAPGDDGPTETSHPFVAEAHSDEPDTALNPLTAPGVTALSTAPYGALTAVDPAAVEPPPAPTTIPGDVWGDLTSPSAGPRPEAIAAAEPAAYSGERPPRIPSSRPPDDPSSVATGSMSMAAASPARDRTHSSTLEWHPGSLTRGAAPPSIGRQSAADFTQPLAPARTPWGLVAAACGGVSLVALVAIVALTFHSFGSPPRTNAPAHVVAVAPPAPHAPTPVAPPPHIAPVPTPTPPPDTQVAAPAPAPAPASVEEHHPAAHHNDAQTIAQARRLLSHHRFAAAERLLANVAARQDANAEVHALRAQALLGQAQPQSAADELREAVRIAPDNTDYLRRYARAQLGLGDRAHAIVTLRHELALNPRDGAARRLLQDALHPPRGRQPAHHAATHHRAAQH